MHNITFWFCSCNLEYWFTWRHEWMAWDWCRSKKDDSYLCTYCNGSWVRNITTIGFITMFYISDRRPCFATSSTDPPSTPFAGPQPSLTLIAMRPIRPKIPICLRQKSFCTAAATTQCSCTATASRSRPTSTRSSPPSTKIVALRKDPTSPLNQYFTGCLLIHVHYII